MGGGFSCSTADSPTTPGLQSVVSEAIEVSSNQLMDAMERFVRAKKTGEIGDMAKFSIGVDVTDQDGWVLVAQKYELPAVLGGKAFTLYFKYKFDMAASTVESLFFPGQSAYDRNEYLTTSYIKVLNDPVRIEHWVDAHEVRSHGDLLKGMMKKVLKNVEATTQCRSDSPSITDPSKLSVVSDPIENGKATADTFVGLYKDFIVEAMGGTELPDGTIVEERSSVITDIGIGTKSFAKHTLNQEEGHIYCHEYGADESLVDLVSTTHVQVHKEPFRLEQWNVQHAGRRVGQAEIDKVTPFVQGVLKYLEEGN